MVKTTRKVAPDGGWGWVTCFGVSLVNLATRAIEPSFGLLFGDLLRDLNVGTTGASVIASLLDVLMNFSGLFVGPLLKEFSYRKVAFIGSLFCGLGMALTSSANSMAHIIVTYSVVNGMGVGLATSAAFVALNNYFKDKRGQAVGLSMAGTALAMLILPQVIRVLLEHYGFRGAVLLMSGLSFHSIVGATLLQPIKWHLKKEQIDVELAQRNDPIATIPEALKEDDEDDLPEMKKLLSSQDTNRMGKRNSDVGFSTVNNSQARRPSFPRVTTNTSCCEQTTPNSLDNSMTLHQRRASVISHLSQLDFSGSNMHVHINIGDAEAEENDRALRRANTTNDMLAMNRDLKTPPLSQRLQPLDNDILLVAQKPSLWRRFTSMMDVDILKDPIYLNILFGLSIFYVAEVNFKMVTPFFLINLGYSKTDVAYCLSITAITDIAARVILPPIFDRLKIKKRLIFFVSIICLAISRSVLAQQTEWTYLVICLSFGGFFRGATLSNFTLTVSEHWSLEKLPAAFGWHMIGKAIFGTAMGPLIGYIRDVSGSYPLCIHSQSICILLCCIAWCIEFVIIYCRRIHKTDTTAATTAITAVTDPAS